MLKVENLHTYHGYIHVLKGIDFSLKKGEMLAIVGSNGAGKSTLLGTLAGVYKAREGKITLEDEEINRLPVEPIVKRGICLVPERRQIFDSLTVKDNLLLGSFHRYRKNKKLLKSDLEEVLEFFPKLQTMLDRPGGLLSGGEQQMLAIGRGLMAKPKLMMLDEPSLGLAPLIVKDIMNILKKLQTEFGTTIILVEQNVKAALQTADRACVLDRGEIILSGEAVKLLNDPAIQETYLGGGKRAKTI